MERIVIVQSREKTFIGKYEGDDLPSSEIVRLTKALEIREMFIPTETGQIHRMVNFATISPFDKTPHTVIIKEVTGIIYVEETSDTVKNYDAYLTHLSAENAGLAIVPPGGPANFSGKFGPIK